MADPLTQGNDGRIAIHITADSKGVQEGAKTAERSVSQMARNIQNEGSKLDDTFKKLGASVAAFFTLAQAKNMVMQVAQVRGEYQKLEVAFETMLQSKEKADSLMAELTKTAATTPFGLSDVASGAKQLLAYGFAAEEVNQTLVDLGNVAAGLSIPLGDIVYLYGSTMVQGRVYTQDMRQFMGRGIPLAKELAKQLGKTENEINAMVTAGKIGFDDVAKAMKAMVSEGGKFENLMEKQSHTIAGLHSNLEDAFEIMLNNIGKQTQDIIAQGYEVAISVVENYEKVGKVLLTIAEAYGVYKASVMAVSAVQAIATQTAKGYTLAELGQYRALLLVEKAQALLNKTMLANPYVLLTAGFVALGLAAYKTATHTSAAAKSLKELEKAEKSIAAGNYDKTYREEAKELKDLSVIIDGTAKGTKQWKEARDTMVEKFGQYDATLAAELDKTGKIGDAYERINSALQKQAKVRAYNAYVSSQSDALNNVADKAWEDVVKRVTKSYEKAKDGQIGGYTLSEALQNINAYIFSGGAQMDSKLRGILAGSGSPFQDLLRDVDEAREAMDKLWDLEDRARRAFGLTAQDTAKTMTTATEEVKATTSGLTDKEKDQQFKYDEQLKARAKQLAELEKSLQDSITNAGVDAMKEGLTKRLAQLAVNHRQELDEISKQEAETLKMLQDNEKTEFLKKGGNERDFKPTITALPAEWAATFAKIRELLEQAYVKSRDEMVMDDARAEESAWDEYLSNYGDYQQKKEAIARIYAERIRKVEESGEAGAQAQIATLKAEAQRTLNSLDFANDAAYKYIFGDPAKMTQSTLQKALDLTRQKMKEIDKTADPESWKALVEAETRLSDAQANLDFEGASVGLMSIAKQMANIAYQQKRINEAKAGTIEMTEGELKLAEDALTKSQQNLMKSSILTGVDAFADGLQKASGYMKEIAEITGDGALAEAGEALEGVVSVIKATAAGAAQGGWIGAVISGVTEAFSLAVEKMMTLYAEMKKLQKEAENIGVAFERLSYEKDYESIFGVNALEKARGAYKSVIAEQARFAKATEGLQDKIVGRSVFGIKFQYKLSDAYPDIFDENGNLILDKAELALEKYAGDKAGKGGDTAYKALQDAVDSAKYLKEKMAEVDEYIGNVFGNLGDDLADAILSGVDAFDVLEDRAGDFLYQFAKDAIKAAIFTDEFKDEYTAKMREALASGDPELLARTLADLNAGIADKLKQAQEISDQIDAAAAEAGIDYRPSRTSSNGGIATATQDSIDELNGRFTAIQMHTASIRDNVSALAQRSSSILAQVMGIHSDTESMKGTLTAMNRTLNDIKENM